MSMPIETATANSFPRAVEGNQGQEENVRILICGLGHADRSRSGS